MKKVLYLSVAALVVAAQAAQAGGESSGGGITNWAEHYGVQIEPEIWIGDCRLVMLPDGVDCQFKQQPEPDNDWSELTTKQDYSGADELRLDDPAVVSPCSGAFVPAGHVCVVGPNNKPIYLPVLIDPPER